MAAVARSGWKPRGIVITCYPSTYGRILALNRQLYHLQMPGSGKHTKKELPFQSAYRHHYWFVFIRDHPYGSRPRRKRNGRVIMMQPSLLKDVE